MNTLFITEDIPFAYSEPTLNEAIALTTREFPGLSVEPTGEDVVGCGWPAVRLIGTVKVLVAALAKWDSGDAEMDLEFTRLMLAGLEEMPADDGSVSDDGLAVPGCRPGRHLRSDCDPGNCEVSHAEDAGWL